MSPRARAGKSSSTPQPSLPACPLPPPKQKRLSSLTASTLLQYCSSILSPGRAAKTKRKPTTKKKKLVSPEKKAESNIPVRARREASSRASALILQQNEIERSRLHYVHASNGAFQRPRTKNPLANKEEVAIPAAPPRAQLVTTASVMPQYALLTEANLAEHTRLQERINNKHQCLVKWTEDLANHGRFSPPCPEEERPIEIPITKQVNPPVVFNPKPYPIAPPPPTPTFLFPSSSPLDLRSFYPLLPFWQYPSWSFQLPKRLAPEPPELPRAVSVQPKKEPLTLHLHTHHHHHHVHSAASKTTRRKSSPIKRRASLPLQAPPAKRRSTSATVTSSSPKKKPPPPPASRSQHWKLVGPSARQLVSLHPDRPPVFRQCYTAIEHVSEKDLIRSHDCVLLRSEKKQRPFLAKVNCFWQEAAGEEIQMAILWYYHPEHTELPGHLRAQFLANELLASKYADCISAACIEDKCYVLNFNEYNRLCAREKTPELFGPSEASGQLKSLLNEGSEHRLLPSKRVASQNIFFCRYVYDYRVKRVLKNPAFVNTN